MNCPCFWTSKGLWSWLCFGRALRSWNRLEKVYCGQMAAALSSWIKETSIEWWWRRAQPPCWDTWLHGQKETTQSSGESPLHMGILWKRTFNSLTGKGQRQNNLYGFGKKQDGKCLHKVKGFTSSSRGINTSILKRGKATTGILRLYPLSFTPDLVEVILCMMPI